MRPSHARWQGRVYSLDGEVEVDGVRYRDFRAETGYGRVDGLGGANCRHSFGPWVPGTPRMYEPEPTHPSGLDNDEVYELTQGQRRRERDIRQTKRELAGAQLIADRDASLANVAEVERLKAKPRGRQEGMRRYIDEANRKGKAQVLQRSPNREWAGDMPRIRKTDASRRTVKEFMEGDGVRRTLRARGISKSAAQKALSEGVRRRGMDPHDFSALSKTSQCEVFRDALSEHASERMAEREVTREQMDDALARPLTRKPIKTDALGRRSQVIIGREATVVVNPDTGRIVTTYRTGTKERKRYGPEQSAE